MESANLISKVKEEKNKLKSIKSKYILEKVFNNLKRGKH